jgi:pimeloyl-ACP methyl ester carboxylesterase
MLYLPGVPALVALLAIAAPPPAAPQGTSGAREELRFEGEIVVLLHGMGRTHRSMAPLAAALRHAGYEVENHPYHSRRHRVEEHGRAFADHLAGIAARDDVRTIHLVGHSLGNIVIRWALANGASSIPEGKIGRVVMLAPPNAGSSRADLVEPWLSWFSRPLPDLTTRPDSTANSIPPLRGVQVGIVAGSRDPIVKVKETLMAGQTAHILVPCGHTFIMRNSEVIELTSHFLRTGSFDRAR